MSTSKISTYDLPAGLVRFDKMRFNPSQQYQVLSTLGYQKGDTLPVVSTNEGGLFPYFLNSKDQKTVMLLRPNSDGSWVVTRGTRRDLEASFGFKAGAQMEAGKFSGGVEYTKEYRDDKWQDGKTAEKMDFSSGTSDRTHKSDGTVENTKLVDTPSASAGVSVNAEAYLRKDTVDIGMLNESGGLTSIGIESKHGYVAGELGAGASLPVTGESLDKLSETLKKGSLKDLKQIIPIDASAKGEVCASKASGILTYRDAPTLNKDGKVEIEEYKVDAGACLGSGRDLKFSDGELRVKAGPFSITAENSTDTGEAFSEGQVEHIKERPGMIEKAWEDFQSFVGLTEDKVDNVPQPIPDAFSAPPKIAEKQETMTLPNEAYTNDLETDSPGSSSGGEKEYSDYWFDPDDKDGYVNMVDPEGAYRRMPLEEAIQKGLVPPGTTTDQMTQYQVKEDKFLNDLDTSDRTDSRADRIANTLYPADPTMPGTSASLDGDTMTLPPVEVTENRLGGGRGGKTIIEIDDQAEQLADEADGHADRAETAVRSARSSARRAAAIAARIRAMLSRRRR